MSFRFSPSIVQSGLVLYLDAANTKSYPTTGTAWRDLSRSGNNGTLINGPTFNSSNGGSIVFDGVNDKIECLSNNITNITTTFTLSIWYNPNALPTNNTLQSLICKYDNTILGFNNGGYDLRLRNDNGTQKIGLVTNSTSNAGGGDINHTLVVNNWYNIIGVYDGSFSKIYVNNTFINQISNIVTPTSNNKPLTIGAFGYYTPINGDLGRYVNGRISQTSIYNRALSQQEILQNYNATKSRYGLT